MHSQDNFLEALSRFSAPRPSQIEYRIYYDNDTGEVLNYTNEDLPGDYIIVDRETFARHRFDCTIKNGKIVPLRQPIGKLAPAAEGTPCHAQDITIIVLPGTTAQYWSMRTYED